jgi:glucose-1-phosphate cytidylyltransferase
MKVVLFCGGLGTRIREYSENVPKPMIPIGGQPILWHVMNYYSQFGHQDFILCLGYKANVVKEFFLDMKPEMFEDCVVSRGGADVQLLGDKNPDWRVTMIDTGVWRNIGQRLWFVRDKLKDEEIFLANYSDGLADIDLNAMIEEFKASNKVGCFVAVRPPLSYHFADIAEDGSVRDIRSVQAADIWINGGFFIFRKEIFDYMREGEELVVEPFRRLLDADLLMARKHTGFWRSMDTLRDRQALVDMVERGDVPWQIEVNELSVAANPDQAAKSRMLSKQDA